MPTPALNRQALYLGDNGRCFCGALSCAGATPHFTGRDLSGDPVERVTKAGSDASIRTYGIRPKCESCGKTPFRTPINTGLRAFWLPTNERWTVTFGGPNGSIVALGGHALFTDLDAIAEAARTHDLTLDRTTREIR